MNTELAYPHVAVGYHLIARVTTDTLAYDESVTTRSGHRVGSIVCRNTHGQGSYVLSCGVGQGHN